MKKKIVSLIFCIIMCFSLLPINAFAAKEPVYYQYYDKNKDGSNGYYLASSQVTDYTVIDDSHMPTNWNDGWYVVQGSVMIDDQVRVEGGTVHLILTDGSFLRCNKSIVVEKNIYAPEQIPTLEIHTQSDGENKGKLSVANARVSGKISCDAAIGGTEGYDCGNIIIHGGNIEAVAFVNGEGYDGGTGIGGGAGGAGGNVTIFDGTVRAAGASGSAGIGGGVGGAGGNVTIYGGNVEALTAPLYNDGGAGIGGGANGAGGKFTIYGGDVHADGGRGAGIGGGVNGSGAEVYLYGGTIWAYSDARFGIGGGENASNNGTITVGHGLSVFNEKLGRIRINNEFNSKPWEEIFSQLGFFVNVTIAPSVSPETYQAYNPKNGKFETNNCADYTFINDTITEWSNGWYVMDTSGSFENRINVSGNVNLIIKDKAKLEALNGIRVEKGASLSVYAQSDGDNQGMLSVVGSENCAGIGSDGSNEAGAFTIHGGKFDLNGGRYSAAVGGGNGGNGGTFTIYGGKISTGAGVGYNRAFGAGLDGEQNGSIVIRPGYEIFDSFSQKRISRGFGKSWIDVLDKAVYYGDGLELIPEEIPEQDPVAYYYYNENIIQNKKDCTKYRILEESENILIDGWYVAKGNLNFDQLTAIGDVHLILMDGCNVKVKQGFHVNGGNSLSIYEQADVEGKSSEKGILNVSVPYSRDSSYQSAGIGGDNNNNCGKVSIHGGTISATGGNRAAGIGGGYNGNGGNITIYGGNVTAKSTNLAAGIGGGQNGNAGNITINGGTVNATGSINAAGIGGGENGNAGNIIINNGNVTAKALDYGTGIGSGCKANGGNVTINDGVVNAVSTYGGAGIGGDSGTNVDVTINGGTVFAKGGTSLGFYDGAGINARNLIVSDGNINVFGGEDACEGIVADNVVVTPKEGMPISVKIEDDNDLSGSPFKTSTNITKLLRWHTFVQFSTAEPNDMPSGIPGNNPVVMPPGQVNKSVKDIDNAINEASQKAAEGQAVETPTVIIDMKQGDDSVATVVPAEILNKIKGQDVNVVFDMGEYSWTINGKEVSASNPEAINLEVIIDSNAVPSDVVNKLADGNPTKQISLTHEGDFGFKAILTLNVGIEYKGKYGNLYWYDSKKGPSFMNSGLIDENGNVSLVFSHASDYVIVISNEDISKKNGINTGDNGMTNISIYLSILVAGVGAATAVVIDKKKYSED